MAYATVIDVLAQNTGRATYTTTSKPTASQVIGYLELTAAELDGILRAVGYGLPIATTATSALKLLEHFNVLGAAAMVEEGAPSDAARRADALHLWEEAKKMLSTGVIELDTDRDTTSSVPRTNTAASPLFSITTDW